MTEQDTASPKWCPSHMTAVHPCDVEEGRPHKSPGCDDPDPSVCVAAGARTGRWSQGPMVHQKGS